MTEKAVGGGNEPRYGRVRMTMTPRQAREAQGLSLDEVARRLRPCRPYSARYIRRVAVAIQDCDNLWVRWGAWFRQQRHKADLTQEEVAKRAGITRQHLGDLEKGQTGAKRDTVIRLAKAIHVKPDDALRRAGFSPTPMEVEMIYDMDDDEREEIVSAFEGHIPAHRKAALEAVKKLLETLPHPDEYTTYGKRSKDN